MALRGLVLGSCAFPSSGLSSEKGDGTWGAAGWRTDAEGKVELEEKKFQLCTGAGSERAHLC